MSVEKNVPLFRAVFDGDQFRIIELRCDDEDAGHLAFALIDALRQIVTMRDVDYVENDPAVIVLYGKKTPRSRYCTFNTEVRMSNDRQVLTAMTALRETYLDLENRLDAHMEEWERQYEAEAAQEALVSRE